MRHRFRLANTRSLVLALACMLALAVGSGCEPDGGERASDTAAEPSQRYQFVNAAGLLVKLDTRAGQAWFSPQSGDGGWTRLGSKPDVGTEPSENGRFRLSGLSQRVKRATKISFVRLDRTSGRTWTIEPRDAAEWTLIHESLTRGDAGTTGNASQQTGDGEPSQPAGSDPETVEFPVISREAFAKASREPGEDIKVITAALENDGLSVQIKVWAARQLGVFEPELAVPPLLDALESKHPEVVVAAIESLRKTADPSTIPRILELRSHPDPRVRAAAEMVVVESP